MENISLFLAFLGLLSILISIILALTIFTKKRWNRLVKRRNITLLTGIGGFVLVFLGFALSPKIESTEKNTDLPAQNLSASQSEKVQSLNITIDSDPSGMDLFVGKNLIGKTPQTFQTLANTEFSYQVAPSDNILEYDLYKSFSASITPVKDENISVWLERTTEDEQKNQKLQFTHNELESRRGNLRTDCHNLVKQNLISPSTAKFPGIFGEYEYLYWDELGVMRYNAHVDSQNGFGAMIRTQFSCHYDLATNRIELAFQ